MKSLIMLLLMVGIIFVAIGYIKTNQECPPNLVEFRYVPRTFQQEQDLPTPIMSLYGKMFTGTSAWQNTAGFNDQYTKKEIHDIDSSNLH